MTDERYRPTTLDAALARVAEECSEVIKLVCKAQRFGLHDVHPRKGKKNIDLIIEELKDIDEAKQDLLLILQRMQPTKPCMHVWLQEPNNCVWSCMGCGTVTNHPESVVHD